MMVSWDLLVVCVLVHASRIIQVIPVGELTYQQQNIKTVYKFVFFPQISALIFRGNQFAYLVCCCRPAAIGERGFPIGLCGSLLTSIEVAVRYFFSLFRYFQSCDSAKKYN